MLMLGFHLPPCVVGSVDLSPGRPLSSQVYPPCGVHRDNSSSVHWTQQTCCPLSDPALKENFLREKYYLQSAVV